MIGLIRVQRDGIVAKTGFKYIRLDPKMAYFSERNMVVYNDNVYNFHDDKLYIHYEERDIFRETMTAVFLRHCIPLDNIIKSCQIQENCTIKRLVFDSSLTKLAPIVFRNLNGPVESRTDLFAYNKTDYFIIEVSLVENNTIREIKWSTSRRDAIDVNYIVQKLKDSSVLYNYIFLTDQQNLSVPIVNQEFTNRQHLERFSRKYSTILRDLCNQDPYDFRSLDVVDLENISVFRITEPAQLNIYKVLDFSSNSVSMVGTGLIKDCLKTIPSDKFVYLFIDDCIYHRIHVLNGITTLFVNTKDRAKIGNLKDRSLLLIKFNKLCLDKNRRIEKIDNI
jgi:hypothetical protein